MDRLVAHSSESSWQVGCMSHEGLPVQQQAPWGNTREEPQRDPDTRQAIKIGTHLRKAGSNTISKAGSWILNLS